MFKKMNSIFIIMVLVISTAVPCFASNANKSFSSEGTILNMENISEEKVPISLTEDRNENRNNTNLTKDLPLIDNVSNARIANTLEAQTTSTNTDASHAELISQFATAHTGSIAVVSEQRWYALSTSVDMKISVKVSMDSTADFDLYMYKLNEETMTLEYIGLSTNVAGNDEYISRVESTGIYYFMINNYSGSGNYALTAYGSNQDMGMEVNDTLSTAFAVNDIENAISGIIDNPTDIDWYKFTVNNYMILDVDFTMPAGTNYALYYSDGESVYQFNRDNYLPLGKSGDYYLVVVSTNASYNNVSPYTINCKTIADGNRSLLVHTSDFNSTFEKDSAGEYYINGNPIDFSYDFTNTVSNSAGTINTYMYLYPGTNFYVSGGDMFGFVDYTTNFFGSESKNRVLVVTLYGITNAKIDRYASGEYTDSAHYERTYARVIIDPDTGKVMDMLEPNYYYEYGNQTYSTISNYTNVY